MVYLKIPNDVNLFLTSGIIVFTIYCINRYTDKEDIINNPEKHGFFKRNPWILWVSIAMLTFSMVLLYWENKLTAQHWAIIILGISYSIKVIPCWKKGKVVWYRIKDIALAKSIIVSLLLGTSFFMIPWLIYPGMVQNKREIILLMIDLTFLIFVNTNFADIRDVDGDRKEGVPTIPVMIGEKRTILFIVIIPQVLLLAVVFYLIFVRNISSHLGIFILANHAYAAFYIIGYYSKKIPSVIIEPLSDACVLVFAVGLLLLRVLI